MKLETLLQRKERMKQEQKNLDSKIKTELKKEAAKKKRAITKFIDNLGIYDLILKDETLEPVFYGAVQELIEILEKPEGNKEKLEQLKEIGIFKVEELKEYKKAEAKKRRESKKNERSETETA